MKFVCVTCDSQMGTVENARQVDDGTMSIVLECPECFSQFGLLTNPMETKILDSLDVSVCPVGGRGREEESRAEPGREVVGEPAGAAPAAVAVAAEPTVEKKAGGGCPFAGAMPKASEADASDDLRWSAAAEKRLTNIPSFIRPVARKSIETFARQQGHSEVTEGVLDEARALIGA